jgi:mono/diheme cytochrome c family protein
MSPTLRSLVLCSGLGLSLAAAARDAQAPPDARRGESLYVGSTRFAAGGAPCLACHGIAGHGLARAASFGPDLSGAYASLGADALDSMLEDVVFPTMQPVYKTRAVTPRERADVVAFLAEAEGAGRAPGLGAGYVAGVVAAIGLFLLFVLAVGRRRAGRRVTSARAPARPGGEP